MFKNLSLIFTHLKRALNFLFQYPFFHDYPYFKPENSGDHEELSTCQCYKWEPTSAEAIECAVCLSKIEEGEEIRESRRCKHMFHRVCLDRWVSYGRMSCPLCRDSLAPRRAIFDHGVEVLLFKFSSFTSSDDRDTWWLR
ncbi:E3 ubiquitin-protein ligase ATL41 [Manihot esculenta]|uniref:RING-type domain-containing protein n=1 Tax=Manihot esculenta TaxID=3983 RepID=A0A2C9VNX4_MANES|nr:E3 ubiquitin-protein ligase ATL41 [Manihot esculenta]OAY47392.1 hypothetical protein MANES_06G076300v8 [Manihot esculenta]